MEKENQTQVSGSQTQVNIVQLPHAAGLSLPSYATPGSAGVDLMAAIEEDSVIEAGQWKLVPTGIVIALPLGMEAQVRSRSGLALKNGVHVLNAPGTIDADYRGEIGVILMNSGTAPFVVSRGMRIAQMVVARYEQVTFDVSDDLGATKRGAGGFGSTGV